MQKMAKMIDSIPYDEKLVEAFQAAHLRLGSWRKAGEIAGVSAPTARRIAMGHIPTHPDIRRKLFLPALSLMPTCPASHVYRTLWSTPTKVLRWQLENRKEV